MLTRPATIMRSAWRGEPRNTSAPNRDTSKRGPAIAIISIAQHARPNPSGQIAFARAHDTTLDTVVNSTPFSISSRRRSISDCGPDSWPGAPGSDGTISSACRITGSAAASARVRNGFPGCSVMCAMSLLPALRAGLPSLFPLERPLPEQVEVAREQDDDEQHHLDEAVEPEPVERDRPRVEEHRLD